MKKTLLLMIATLFAISAMGQPVNKKAGIIGSRKLQDFEGLKGLLVTGQKLDTTISETWDGTGSTWISPSRRRYTYSVVGLTTTTISSIRSISTGFLWVNSDKTETTVDGSGNTTLEITYTWDNTNSVWVGSTRTESTYTGGKLASSSTYTWNTGTSQWDGLFRTEYTYTGVNLTIDIGLNWDNTLPTPGWVNSTKTEYTYTSGILTSDISFDWDKTLPVPDWVNSSKTVYTYSGVNIASVTSSDWDKTLPVPDWVNSSKSDYTYTGGKITTTIVSSWISGLWVNASKFVSEYNDPDGRNTLTAFYLWDSVNSVWTGFLQYTTSYGVLGPLNFIISIGSSWDIINSQWVNQSRSTNWYSDLVTAINKVPEMNLRVYPNPAKEFVVFDNFNISESATIELFDIQGRKIMDQQLYGNDQISVKGLAKGMYIYKLHNNGIIYTGRLLKK